MGRINDVLIVANRNYVPVDFIVLDIDSNPSCPIILGRPFLRTIDAIIDMMEGNSACCGIFRVHFERRRTRIMIANKAILKKIAATSITQTFV